MKTPIRAGEVIETTTPDEFKEHLSTGLANYFQERARGVNRWNFISQPVTVAGGKVQLPATTDNQCGPNNGFACIVTVIRIKGLASGDVIKVFRNSISGEQVDEGVMPATGTLLKLTEPSKGLLLTSNEQLIFTGTGLTATGDITISCEGVECPAPDFYKLLS